jgi:hypothetical protein
MEKLTLAKKKNATDQSVGILISLQDSIKEFEY